MNDDFTYLYQVAKAIILLYSLINIGVIVYGIKSVVTKSSLLLQDDESSYQSHYGFKFGPHRIFAKDSKFVSGEAGSLTGWAYIILGLFMLSPVLYIVIFGTSI